MPANPMGQGVPMALLLTPDAKAQGPDVEAGAAFLQMLDALPAIPAAAGPTEPVATTPAALAAVVAPTLPVAPVLPKVALPEEPLAPEDPDAPETSDEAEAGDPSLALLLAVAPATPEEPAPPAIATAGSPDTVLPTTPIARRAEPAPRADARSANQDGPRPQPTAQPAAGAEVTADAAPELEAELLERLTSREAPRPRAQAPRPRAQTPQAAAPTASPGAGEAAPTEPTVRPSDVATRAAELVDPEPLPGSIRLDGVRAARVTVPMEDGSVVRARVDVADETVDVALRASPETGLSAEQRVGELRQALSEHGLRLGEFEVTADPEARQDDAGEQARDDDRDPGNRSRPSSDRASSSGAMSAPGDASSANTPYARPDEEGRGGLLNRRF